MTYQNAADKAAFEHILARDPSSLKCFECGYDNAPWCDISHGIFVCLDCSGQFRGLGVHLAFVRSSTMDGWSDWKPEKLAAMKCGGNAKCRAFFNSHGVPATGMQSLKARYSSRGALMYKDKLEAEAAGQSFNEATWQPPQWWLQEQQKPAATMGASPAGGGGGARGQQQQPRYGGVGSAPAAGGRKSADSDFLDLLGTAASSLATGASRVAESAVAYGSKAVEDASTATRGLVDNIEKSSTGTGLSKKAQETGEVVSEAATNAWGALSSWTTTGFASLTAIASQATTAIQQSLDDDSSNSDANGAGAAADSLSALTKNVRPAQQDYGHAEHKAEAGANAETAQSLERLSHRVPPSKIVYESIASSPMVTEGSSVATAVTRSSSSSNSGFSGNKFPRTGSSPTMQQQPMGRQSSIPTVNEYDSSASSPVVNSRTPVTASSPVLPASTRSHQPAGPKPVMAQTLSKQTKSDSSSSSASPSAVGPPAPAPGSPPSSKEKAAIPDDWGWDD